MENGIRNQVSNKDSTQGVTDMATSLEKWVEEVARLTKPAKIYWCDGSEAEAQKLIKIGERLE